MRTALFLLMVCLPSCTALLAQRYHWVNYRLPSYLEKARASKLFERHNGLIHLATSEGLYSFDGNRFSQLPRHGGSSADVSAVFEDLKNTLWIGYADGSIDHYRNGHLEAWEPEEGHPATAITGFAEDDHGQLWMATYGEGAYVFSKGRLYNVNIDDGIASNDIYAIARQRNGEVWLGTDGGISICRFHEERKTITNLSRIDGLPDEIVRVIIPDGAGNCWIGTHDKGPVHYDHVSGTFQPALVAWSHGPITDLNLIGDRELIVATENTGVWRLDLETKRLTPVNPERDTPTNETKIKDLLQDDEGGLWLLSDRQGLFRANPQLTYVEARELEVQALLLDRTGTLWTGTDQGLLELSAAGDLRPYPAAGKLNIVSLFEDRFGNLWLGTFGEGVYIINPESGKMRHLGQQEGLLNGSILSIDGKGNRLYLASLGGVAEVTLTEDPLTKTPLSLKSVEGLKTDFIYQVLAETPDRVWMATDGEGLALLDGGELTHLRNARTVAGDSVELRRVYSLSATEDGRVWFNTARDGLFEITGDNLFARGTSSTLSGESITGMAAAPPALVVAHTEGVALLDLTSGKYQNIGEDHSEGPDLRPILNAVESGQHGQVWFGCSGGLIRYQRPSRPMVSQARVILASVTVYPLNDPRPGGSRFSPSENTLAFDFTSLWYANPESVQCRYQLEGYDPGWIETRNQRVIYSKLAPGQYVFKVAATANNDWDNADVKTYRFSISTPVWRRWWALTLMGTVLLLVINRLIIRRDQQLRRESLLQKQRIESQYEALKSQINPHFLFNSFNTLVTMIEESPADAVTYTESLSDLFRNVLAYRDRETIPVSEELELLADYLFLLDKRFGKKLVVSNTLTGQEGFIVPLSLQLLVENAIKHNVVSASRPLRIDIGAEENGKYVFVRNSLQPKLREEPSTGFGLASLAQRYALLTSEEIKTERSEAEFRIRIPIIPTSGAKNTI